MILLWHKVVCQTGIYKLSLTKLSQSYCPIYVSTQQHSSFPNTESLSPVHLSKLPTSPVLITPLFTLAHALLARTLHYVAPAPAILITVPGSGRDMPGYTHMFMSIPCPIVQ